LASSPPSQPESCGCEKFFLAARDFFSDICQVGSWESTCLLYAATSTVGKEDSRPNSPADKLFLPLFFLVDQKYFLIISSTNLVDQINFYVFRLTKFILTFLVDQKYFLIISSTNLVDQINFYVFRLTKFILTFLVDQIHFYVFRLTKFILTFLVDQIHFYVFWSDKLIDMFLVRQILFLHFLVDQTNFFTFFG
jgi:hypothetical protein